MLQLKFAIRSLLRTPVVTVIAVISVALGIGANVAIFSIFNHILLRPLPVQEPHRLVNLASPGPRSGSTSCGQAGPCDAIFSYPMFRDLERIQTVFTGIAAHRDFGANIAYGGVSEGGDSTLVSGSYFDLLGLSPHLGRLLNRDDDRERGSGRVVVLSHDYWRRRFGERSNIIGQAVLVNGQVLTIVGVAPKGFNGTTLGHRPLMYVPISMRESLVPRWTGLDNRRSYWAYLFARLKPGIPLEQARAGLNTQYRAILTDVDLPLQQGMRPSMLAQFRDMQLQLEPGARGQSRMPGESRQPLTLLFGITAIVLLICCANVANLLLGRAASRSTEIAVRLSIGAGRKHIIGQLLVESLLIGVIGGGGGLLVAHWTLTAMSGMLPGATETLSPQIDGDMLVFAGVLSLTTALIFGLFPAIHSTRPNLLAVLKANAGQPSGAKAAARFRVTLATAQVALSMALLVSAGLFTKSLLNISRVELGLDTDKIVVFGVSPAMNGHGAARTRQMLETIEDELSGFPGVSGVTTARVRLISGDASMSSFQLQGVVEDPDTDSTSAFYNFVGPDFLRTLGIPLLAGREFSRADVEGAPTVAIVNEAFLRKFKVGGDAVGKRMHRAGRSTNGFDIEIVGVAADTAYNQVKEQAEPLVMLPYRQDPDVAYANFYVRTAGSQQDLLAAIPRLIRDIDPTLPVADLRTMAAQVSENVALDRFVTSMSAAFASLATLLAALGLYGVLAYTVTQRTREFGLRMALGADAANVRRLVLRQVGLMTCVGAAIGLASALALGRAAESLLFKMSARDPTVFAGAAIVLIAVALCAGLIPAQRAARVDPMTALRYE